jgi:biotin transport system substrate-specific component
MFAALVAVGAFIRIPIGLVPITFQVFFSVLSGLLLGSKLGAGAVLTYILIGLTGVPVFTQGGGIGYVLQPSFGYLLGFVVGAYVTGLIVEKAKEKNFKTYLIAAFAFLVPCYLIGLLYLYIIVNFHLGSPLSVGTLFVSFFAVFLPNDILSYVLAALIAKKVRPILVKQGDKA